jgi:cytoskeletal protein CcmA (bactofilin family)
MADPIIPDDSISGNKVHGGVISEFQSTGIQDLATQTSLVVSNGTATVDRIRTKVLDGNVSVNGNMVLAGSIAISENVELQRDLTIRGNIDANTITVRNLIADVKQETREPVTFVGTQNADANGKGIAWRAGSVNESILYKNGVLASTLPIEAPSFKIKGSEILTETALATSVTSSGLRRLGRLEKLNVDGTAEINGDVTANKSLTVSGSITADEITARVIKVDQLITDAGTPVEIGNFTADSENSLDGQGLHFIYGTVDNMLAYRQGGRLWTNLNFDLQTGRSYSIDTTTVLSIDTLGPTVVKSSLREVGPLTSLRVRGNASISDFAYFTETRLGLGTENPNAALSVFDNNIEIVVGSSSVGQAKIGTHTNDGLEIVTDNVARISIANNGEVVIGHPDYKNGVLRVYGKLYVDEVVAESRTLRKTSLQFDSTNGDSIYNKGIVWTDSNKSRSFTLASSPDRIVSSEHIELADSRSFFIGDMPVLTKTMIGPSVTESSLNTLGVLRELTVDGESNFSVANARQIKVTDGNKTLTLNKNTIDFSSNLVIGRNGEAEVTIDGSGITLGNSQNTSRPVRIFGRLGVGVNNPDESVGLAVAGNLSFANKKFVNGTEVPTSGSFRKGDICWNDNPATANYAGWICIAEGTPGEWRPFGLIA